MQLCPVVRVHAVPVVVLDAAAAAAAVAVTAAPLGLPLLIEEAAYRGQGAHRDKDHSCDHTWGDNGERVLERAAASVSPLLTSSPDPAALILEWPVLSTYTR